MGPDQCAEALPLYTLDEGKSFVLIRTEARLVDD